MRVVSTLKRLARDHKGAAAGVGALGLIIGGLIAVLVLYNTAGTIEKQSENAALEAELYDHGSSPPLFRLGGLFWAIAGIAIMAGIAIGALKMGGVV